MNSTDAGMWIDFRCGYIQKGKSSMRASVEARPNSIATIEQSQKDADVSMRTLAGIKSTVSSP
jgi:hypothetical protein